MRLRDEAESLVAVVFAASSSIADVDIVEPVVASCKHDIVVAVVAEDDSKVPRLLAAVAVVVASRRS